MKMLHNYLIFTLSIFSVLLLGFIYLVLNNISSGFLNVIAVLMGSSLTASLALVLESYKVKEERIELENSVQAEIDINTFLLKQILKKLIEQENLIKTNSKDIIHPMPHIKTDLWNILKSRIDKNVLYDDYEKLIEIVSGVEYINDHLRDRDGFINTNLNSQNGDLTSDFFKNLEMLDKGLIENIGNIIKVLENLSISFD